MNISTSAELKNSPTPILHIYTDISAACYAIVFCIRVLGSFKITDNRALSLYVLKFGH